MGYTVRMYLIPSAQIDKDYVDASVSKIKATEAMNSNTSCYFSMEDGLLVGSPSTKLFSSNLNCRLDNLSFLDSCTFRISLTLVSSLRKCGKVSILFDVYAVLYQS